MRYLQNKNKFKCKLETHTNCTETNRYIPKKKKIYILNWSTLLLNVILVNKLQLKFCFPHDLGIYITIQNIIQGNEGMERQADSIKEK